MSRKANYYKRDEFKDWLDKEKVQNKKLTQNSADQYPTYVGYIFDGRDLLKDERQNFSSAMEMYQEFLKTLP
ncbi:MAG: hypothetical protein F082_90 [bacterium F082]|nr:MAG: hypothetical protein F082_90 [bacterium F082]KWW31839.1 MAG: hypothetical protein AUK64_88 [bacterium P201]